MVLLAVLREVLLAADAEHPAEVSTRAYDAKRIELGYGATPRADKLCTRFGVGWADLRSRCLTSADPSQEIATSAATSERRVLTRAEAVFAVQRVAAHLGTDQLTVHGYEEGRRALDAALFRRHRHGSQMTPLPSADSIRRKMSWPTLLADAGLRPPKKPDPAMPRDEAIAVSSSSTASVLVRRT